MFLLDTPVIHELRGAKADKADAGVRAWAANTPRQQLFISALTLVELEESVTRAERADKADGGTLRAWLDDRVMTAFEGRILAVDTAVARRRPSVALADNRDALVAATALVHGLTIVTPNAAAYRAGRLKTFNPWGYAGETAEDIADWRQATKTAPSG
ncbi:PIN domain-containing protein [Azospirillum sp. B4]|uniref:PIN domain-containing protein n=1 Tax=Azospirillum sp. B4 TaxID=95605 RepID=UPI00034547CC|nr:PIN domain-containing protein [Azospirillum sp. B4]